jgi:hypothetical protein
VKFLLQLIIVVLLGGILVQLYSRERDRDRALNEFRKDLLSGVTRAYNDTKKVRRMLRAGVVRHGESNDQRIPSAIYEAQLEKLLDPQLEFEFYKRQLEAIHAFKDNKEVTEELRLLEKYLNKIFKEYQDGEHRTSISPTPSTQAIRRTGPPRAWHPSARAGSATACGP